MHDLPSAAPDVLGRALFRATATVALTGVLSCGALLHAQQPLRDLAKSSDHPLVSRYAGATLIGYDVQQFAESSIPLASVGTASDGRLAARKEQKVEGRITRILYVVPEGRTSLEVLRNYQRELTSAGFQTLFGCDGDACGQLARHVYPPDRILRYGNKGAIDLAEYVFRQGAREGRYLALSRQTGDKRTFITLLVGKPLCCAEYTASLGVTTFDRVHVLQEIVEPVAMDSGNITVSAAAMGGAIANAGHAVLYGIYFDTAKADIKPESAPALQEIATLLKTRPELRLHVVGHTDNVGAFDANTALSLRRARAVVDELTAKYGIPATRLHAAGVGSLAPLAPNDTEEGRSRNRRVELVQQ